MNTNMPKISVIIPCYNAEKYIARCLQSVLENTYQNLEVLCINDGSTDKSEEVLHDIASKDSRVKVLIQPNQGVSVARNHGLDVATGDYVAFIDADDWVHKQYFECLLNACLKNGTAISVCKYREVYDVIPPITENGSECQVYLVSAVECFENNYIKTDVWGRIIVRDIVENLRFEKGMAFGEDSTFMFKLLCDHPHIKVSYINRILYYYFQRPGEFSGKFALSEAHLARVDCYLKYIDSLKSPAIKQIAVEETCKRLYQYRYEARIERKFKAARQNFQIRYSVLKKYIKYFSLKNKMIYQLLAMFPFLYRFVRIMKDKTLLGWEKVKPQLVAQYNAQK